MRVANPAANRRDGLLWRFAVEAPGVMYVPENAYLWGIDALHDLAQKIGAGKVAV